jgi:hypothetical protein
LPSCSSRSGRARQNASRITCNSLAGALPLFATGGLLFGWAPMIFAPPPLLAVAGCTLRRPLVRKWSAALAVLMIGGDGGFLVSGPARAARRDHVLTAAGTGSRVRGGAGFLGSTT